MDSHKPDLTNILTSTIVKNPNEWKDDKHFMTCYSCQSTFSLFLRRHHCRYCGNIFCYSCCDYSIIIPNYIRDRIEPDDYWNISYYVPSLKAQEERVCKNCYDMIFQKIILHNSIVEMFKSCPSIIEINNNNNNNKYYHLRQYYFEYLRNIQYYLPNHVYTKIDFDMLYKNAEMFVGHSKYITNLIKCIDWDHLSFTIDSEMDIESVEENKILNEKLILKILNTSKSTCTCADIYCTRTCSKELDCEDCLNILYQTYDCLPDSIVARIFEIFGNVPGKSITCYMPLFINFIKINSINKKLNKHIYDLIFRTNNIQHIYYFYWLLKSAIECSDLIEIDRLYVFIRLIDKQLELKMSNEYTFYKQLTLNLDDITKFLIRNFDKVKPISLPYDPNVKLIGVDYDSIVVKDSYTKPVIIRFLTTKGPIKLLFKLESIMNDLVILNLIELFDDSLKKYVSQNFQSISYKAVPLGRNAGMIEIIDKAETIQSMGSEGKSILQYILENNESNIVGNVLDVYTYSLVSYTLQSYFFGLGDRHLENIMITTEGSIFHIDFGFILGRESQPISMSYIRVNSEMIQVLGGRNSERYKLYRKLCSSGLIILRKHIQMMFLLLSQLEYNGRSGNFAIKEIEQFLITRCQPEKTDDTVIAQLYEIIEQSQHVYIDHVRDFLHYHTKEKTVQNSMAQLIGNIYDVYKNIKKPNSSSQF